MPLTPAFFRRIHCDEVLSARVRVKSAQRSSSHRSSNTRSMEFLQSPTGLFQNHSCEKRDGLGPFALHSYHTLACSSFTQTVITTSLSVGPILLTTPIWRPSRALPRTKYFHSRVIRSRCRSTISPVRIARSTSNTDRESSSSSSKAWSVTTYRRSRIRFLRRSRILGYNLSGLRFVQCAA